MGVLIPDYLRDAFQIKCPKCLEKMKLFDEDTITKKFGNTEFDTERVRYYECPNCKTNAIVSRRYQYIDEDGQDILPDGE